MDNYNVDPTPSLIITAACKKGEKKHPHSSMRFSSSLTEVLIFCVVTFSIFYSHPLIVHLNAEHKIFTLSYSFKETGKTGFSLKWRHKCDWLYSYEHKKFKSKTKCSEITWEK